MASPELIAELRALVAEPDNEAPYTDDYLGALIDGKPTLRAAARSVWQSKAAHFAHLVNISEAGSSRSMGDLYKNALAMAEVFNDDSVATASSAASTTRLIEIDR